MIKNISFLETENNISHSEPRENMIFSSTLKIEKEKKKRVLSYVSRTLTKTRGENPRSGPST